jgi:hypothetical protein
LTADGRRTLWGTFLRADGLHQLTPASQDTLIDYGVRTVVDLRLTRELNLQPDVFADRPEVKYHHENVLGDEYQEGDFPDLGEPADRLFDIYKWCSTDVSRRYGTPWASSPTRPPHVACTTARLARTEPVSCPLCFWA